MVNPARPFLVFTADLHFDETGAWKYRGIVGDAQHSFLQVVDFCCRHKPTFLLLGGDIMDRPNPKPETVRFLRQQFDRLAQARVQVLYILGQHDGRQAWPSIHPDPIHLGFRLMERDGIKIYGLDYQRPAAFRAAYAGILKYEPDFLLCHQVWREFMGNARQAELAMAELPTAIPLLTGDYHVHTNVRYTAVDGTGATAYSPGSTHMRDVAEDPQKYFYTFTRDADGGFMRESVGLQTRPARRVKVGTPADLERLLAEVVPGLPLDGVGIDRLLLDVAYYDDLDGAAARLTAALEDRCFLFLRPRRRKRDEQPIAASERRQAALLGLPGVVALATEPGPVRDSVLRLLEAPDPGVELAAMKQEFFKGEPCP